MGFKIFTSNGQGVFWWFRIYVEDISQFNKIKLIKLKPFKEFNCQLETNESGKFQIQGYTRLHNRCRFTVIRTLLASPGFDVCDIQVGRLITTEDIRNMSDYIDKADTRVGYEFQFRYSEERNMNETKHSTVLQLLRDHGETEALGYFNLLGLKAMFWRNAIESYNLELHHQKTLSLRESFVADTWKPWQKDLYDVIIGKPDQRKVYSIVDFVGNCGKTYFVRRATSELNDKICSINNGKSADLAMIVSCHKYADTILMSLPRSVEVSVNYQAIEQFKDGVFCSTKYESTSYVGDVRHLVIFSNFSLKLKQLSLDRWVIWMLDKNGGYKEFSAEEYMCAFPNDSYE